MIITAWKLNIARVSGATIQLCCSFVCLFVRSVGWLVGLLGVGVVVGIYICINIRIYIHIHLYMCVYVYMYVYVRIFYIPLSMV